MCDVSGISEVDLDWSEAIDRSVVELNGRKYTVLEEDAMFAGLIYKHEPHGYTLQNRFVTTEVGGSVEAGVEIEWGGKDGTKIKGSGKGEVYDEKGNYVKVEAWRDNTGQSKVSGWVKKENEK